MAEQGELDCPSAVHRSIKESVLEEVPRWRKQRVEGRFWILMQVTFDCLKLLVT